MERIASRRRLVAAGSLGTAGEVLKRLRATADPSRLGGMGRFGIDTRSALGVTVTELRGLARQIGRDHDLAAALWESEVHEARILATMVDEPSSVTEAQMERWVSDLGSWDLCDQLCGNLFDRTPFAFDKALAWSRREEEFVKRAGFALMATSAVHRKDVRDARFEVFFPAIGAQATDDRNYVKKAVSWALRQIGKRSLGLNQQGHRDGTPDRADRRATGSVDREGCAARARERNGPGPAPPELEPEERRRQLA